MNDLSPEIVRPLLTGSLGEPYRFVGETTSTQDLLTEGDLPHGAVAVTEHQTAGRGRSGRRWDDAPSKALLFSILMCPPGAAPLPQLSLVAGLAVASAIEAAAGVPAMVKWPNDVLLDGRKVAGILLEASGTRVVCGIGINVNQDATELPATTRSPTTSLQLAGGAPLDRGEVLAAVLLQLERLYHTWLEGGLTALLGDLEQRNAVRGRRVRVSDRTGTAGEIAPDGRLTITLDRGDVVLVESGEVELGPSVTLATG